jgi:hypothetical protein
MATTFELAGARVTYVNDMTPQQIKTLSAALALARHKADQAARNTQRAAADLRAGRALPADFRCVLAVNFRLTAPAQDLEALSVLAPRLAKLAAGLKSEGLHISEYGYRLLADPDRRAVGQVQKNFSQLFSLDCLNEDPLLYKNDNDIILRFDSLTAGMVGDVANTLVHEGSHKFLDTRDFAKNPPWGRGPVEWCNENARLGVPGFVPPDWAALPRDKALHNAYGIENYVSFLPDLEFHSIARETAEAFATSS